MDEYKMRHIKLGRLEISIWNTFEFAIYNRYNGLFRGVCLGWLNLEVRMRP